MSDNEPLAIAYSRAFILAGQWLAAQHDHRAIEGLNAVESEVLATLSEYPVATIGNLIVRLARRAAQAKRQRAYDERYPRYCERCLGSGEVTTLGIAGDSHKHICPVCITVGKCPRCAQRTMPFRPVRCEACGFRPYQDAGRPVVDG